MITGLSLHISKSPCQVSATSGCWAGWWLWHTVSGDNSQSSGIRPLKHIALAVPMYSLAVFIPQDTGHAHLITKQSRACLLFPPLILICCTVYCHQFSHFSYCLKWDLHFAVYYQYQPLLSPKVIWIRVPVENSLFISIIMFLVLLCFVPVALPQSIFCRFCGKAAIATYHRALLLWSLCWSPALFTHSAADLIIAGLHCSKLGNFRLPFLGLFNLRLACNEGIIWKVCLFSKQLCGCCLVRCAQPRVKLAVLSADSNIAAAMWSSEPQITSQAVRAFWAPYHMVIFDLSHY